MNTPMVVSGILVPAFVLLLAWLMPALAAPDLPFGARIPLARREEPVLAAERRGYHRRLALSGGAVLAAGCVLAATAGPRPHPALLLAPAFAALAATLTCYVLARRAVLAAKQAGGWYEGLRQGVATDTSLRTGPHPVRWLWALPALLITLATAVLGALRYADLPARLPTHFGADGTADQFAAKSPLSAFAPVLAQLLVTAVLSACVRATARSRADLDPARPATGAARHRRYLARLGAALLVLAAAVDLTLLLAARSIWSAATTISPLPLLAPVAFGLAVLTTVAVRTGQGGSRLPADPTTPAEPDTGLVHTDDDRHWRLGGTVYLNRQDPALLVPKRFGIGWSLNLGNPRAVLLTVLFLALVTVLPLLH
ncbi:hypothetical protein CFP65_7094 [Kitasatospora sp. MMS16-BH015]|uniref:DUF1648 domain-containing protein n=1 Tax=Kitasatospora sp. MMS16-BH015 TaxID=2018025 RepID=UPI000CA24E20|nr:DUF5808 domain-containing protein [Kitasatospora sp. MMS16-BH015]AUG81698.1 hypothetical protein CFP65_7094 [Kitasatospora sp. MMS16-BH015]